MILERKRLTPLILCLLLTLFSLVLHTLPQVNTMINYVKEGEPKQTGLKISDRFLSYAVNYHKTLPDFQKRQVTTTIIEWVANVFNLRIAVSFVWVNFSFIFFCSFDFVLLLLFAKVTGRIRIVLIYVIDWRRIFRSIVTIKTLWDFLQKMGKKT